MRLSLLLSTLFFVTACRGLPEALKAAPNEDNVTSQVTICTLERRTGAQGSAIFRRCIELAPQLRDLLVSSIRRAKQENGLAKRSIRCEELMRVAEIVPSPVAKTDIESLCCGTDPVQDCRSYQP